MFAIVCHDIIYKMSFMLIFNASQLFFHVVHRVDYFAPLQDDLQLSLGI